MAELLTIWHVFAVQF